MYFIISSFQFYGTPKIFMLELAKFFVFILGSICTAYAFIASIHILKFLSPYTLVLTYNLEPVYGILLAIFIFPETEKMQFSFYIGTVIIISTIIINSALKIKNNKKVSS